MHCVRCGTLHYDHCKHCLSGVQGRQLLSVRRNNLQHMHRGQVHQRLRREHVHHVRRRAGVRPIHRHDDVLPVHRQAADLRYKQNVLLLVQRRSRGGPSKLKMCQLHHWQVLGRHHEPQVRAVQGRHLRLDRRHCCLRQMQGMSRQLLPCRMYHHTRRWFLHRV